MAVTGSTDARRWLGDCAIVRSIRHLPPD